MSGLALASATAIGSALCEFGRKRLTGCGLDPSTIVSLVCLLQGVIGLSGLAILSGSLPIPVAEFWPNALASAGLSAMTASLLTKAYSENDISLCAPYNAGLPVFQFIMTTFILRDEAQLPVHKVAGVLVVCACSFWLARVGKASSNSLLPPGATSVLACCAIWSVVTKFDQEATKAAGSPCECAAPHKPSTRPPQPACPDQVPIIRLLASFVYWQGHLCMLRQAAHRVLGGMWRHHSLGSARQEHASSTNASCHRIGPAAQKEPETCRKGTEQPGERQEG